MRYLIFLCPLLMDMAAGCFFFAVPVEASRLGASSIAAGWLMAMSSIVYVLFSHWLGGFVSEQHADRLISISAVILTVAALFLLAANTLWMLYICMILVGVTLAIFFISFQVFMGSSTSMHPLRSAAIYGCAWSLGMSVGPLVEGVLFNVAKFWIIIPILLIAVGIPVLHRLQQNLSRGGANIGGPGLCTSPANDRRYLRIGRFGIFAAAFTGFGMKGLLPKIGIEELTLTPAFIGIVLFLSGVCQALTALGCQYLTRLHYNRKPLPVVYGVGMAGMAAIIAWPNSPAALLVGLGVFGITSGILFHQAVFYALNQPAGIARNVSVNEILVGAGSVAGSVTCGYAAEYFGARGMFAVAAGALGVICLIQHFYRAPAGTASDRKTPPVTDKL